MLSLLEMLQLVKLSDMRFSRVGSLQARPRCRGERIEEMTVASRRSQYVGDRLLTVGEVAALMRVSNMTVYRLIKSGSLAAIRVGKNYRIRESDVNRYLSDRAVRPDGA